MRGAWRRIRDLLGSGRSREELDEEMRFHLDRLAEDLEAEGLEPDAARREATRRFGSRDQVQERVREARGLALAGETLRNVRFALRGLVRDPVFAATFVLTLGLTVGLGTLAVGVGEAALWRPLPLPDPDRLHRVVLHDAARGPSPDRASVDGATWERVRDRGGFMDRAVYSTSVAGVNLDTDRAAAFVRRQRVGAGYFYVLGVPPVRGREFTPAEDVPDGPAVAVLSHRLWSEAFGADPAIVGGTVRLRGEPHTVVGIMPPGFRTAEDPDVWTPLRPSPTGEGSGTNYAVLARLPAGLDATEAAARLAAVPVPDAWAERDGDYRLGLLPLDRMLEAEVRTPVTVLLAGVALMLLVGWANLAGLQLARTLARGLELATRRAVGGGSGALVRQMVAENAVLGVLGGGLGLAVALLAAPALEEALRVTLGTWQPLPSPWAMAATAASLALLAAAVYGAGPLLEAARAGRRRLLVAGTRRGGGHGHRARRALLVGQMALVTVLLFSAGLLARSYGHLAGLEPGFEAEGVLTVRYSLDDERFAGSGAVAGLLRESIRRLEGLPSVQGAAAALSLPYQRPLNMPFYLPGEEEPRITNLVYVSGDFFRTLRIPLLRGRTLRPGDPGSDRPSGATPVEAVVNQAFVDRHLADGDPLGRSVEMRNGFGDVPVVGVVGNVQQVAGFGGGATPVWETPTMYVHVDRMPAEFLNAAHVWFAPSWVVRGTGSTVPTSAAVTEIFDGVVPELPVAGTAPLPRIVADAFARQRFEAVFLLALAGLSLLLAGVGLYGIVAQEVLERRAEMGVRMALGASPARAAARTAAGGLLLASAGLGIGLVLSLAVRGVLDSLVYGVGTLDPVTFAGLALTLGLLATIASWVPASRIGRLDPARVLRDS
jgi:predicted permease